MPGMILETLELLFRRKNWVEVRYRRWDRYVLVGNRRRGRYMIVWSKGDCGASSKIEEADQLGFRCFSGKEDKLLDSGRVSSYTCNPIASCFNPHSSPHPRRERWPRTRLAQHRSSSFGFARIHSCGLARMCMKLARLHRFSPLVGGSSTYRLGILIIYRFRSFWSFRSRFCPCFCLLRT